MADYIYSMETRLTPNQQSGVNLVQEIARHAGIDLYLAGGTIRDLITGFPIRDIDLSIQGNPLRLQKELEKAGISVQGVDEELRILYLLMPGNVRAELNMTRAETYDTPGKPPAIASATINEDLRRRDFTVNAMALSLNPGSRGLLLDPSLPADNSPLVSGEMRGQFQAIQNNFDDLRVRLIALTPLGLTVSNPPTQADVQALADKLDELINTLNA